MIYAVDFDDYCDATVDTLEVLRDLREHHSTFKVTLFAIPKRCSPFTIASARALYPWLQLAPHGWRHTRGECLGWTDEEAHAKLVAARDMGIDAPIFRAPGWLIDGDTYTACSTLDYAIASHSTYRIPHTGVREYVYNLRTPSTRQLRAIHGHLTPVAGNHIRDMLTDGRLTFATDSTFTHLPDIASVITATPLEPTHAHPAP